MREEEMSSRSLSSTIIIAYFRAVVVESVLWPKAVVRLLLTTSISAASHGTTVWRVRHRPITTVSVTGGVTAG